MSSSNAIRIAGTVLLIGATVGTVVAWHDQTVAPCASPIGYYVGSYDARFGISKADFLSAMQEAAGIWNKAAGVNVLVYEQGGALPVNLIYDSRQAKTQQNQTLQSSIDAGKAAASSVQEEYQSLIDTYDADKTSYEQKLAAYTAALDSYNQTVQYWNTAGGAPPQKNAELNAEQASLAVEQNSLESARTALNAEAAQINALIDKYNLLAAHVNQTVATVNQTAGSEFEEGEYVSDASGKRINIYEFTDRAKLVRVLAHEFGHALGLPHNTDPKSIMYYLNQSTNLVPSSEDIAALKTACHLNSQ